MEIASANRVPAEIGAHCSGAANVSDAAEAAVSDGRAQDIAKSPITVSAMALVRILSTPFAPAHQIARMWENGSTP